MPSRGRNCGSGGSYWFREILYHEPALSVFMTPKEGGLALMPGYFSVFKGKVSVVRWGIVLQDPYLSWNHRLNVAMDKEDYGQEEIITPGKGGNAGDMLARLDKGIDEPVVERSYLLQWRGGNWLGFARTLIANPKILILDEATPPYWHGDRGNHPKAMEVVKEESDHLYHRPPPLTIQNADQILVLDAGQIIEQGAPTTNSCEWDGFAEMQKIQQKVWRESKSWEISSFWKHVLGIHFVKPIINRTQIMEKSQKSSQ